MIVVEYEQTYRDYVQGLQAHLRQGGGMTFRPVHWMAFGAAIVGTLRLANHWHYDTGVWLDAALLTTVGWAIAGYLRVAGWSSFQSAWKSSERVRGAVTWQVDEQGIRHQSAHGETFFRWPAWQRYIETETLFILYLTDDVYQVLAKRVFESESQMDEFRRLLEEKLSEPVRGFPVQ